MFTVNTEQSFEDLVSMIKLGEAVVLEKYPDSLVVSVDTESFTVIFEGEFVDKWNSLTELDLFTSKNKKYTIIKSEKDFEAAIKDLKEAKIAAFDTETSGLNVRKDKVIGFSWTSKIGTGFYYPIYTWDALSSSLVSYNSYGSGDILHLLSKIPLIMHNASFDIRVVKSNLGIDLSNSLYHDTILSEHTLNEEGPFGLKDLAVIKSNFLKLDSQDLANQEQVKLGESVLKNGGKWLKYQKEIWRGDLDDVGYYAIADTDITLRLFYHNQKELSRQNLTSFFYEEEVMPLLKEVTIPMEDRGVRLDMSKLSSNLEDISENIEKYKVMVLEELKNQSEWKTYISDFLNEEIPMKNSGAFVQKFVEYRNLPINKLDSGKYSLSSKNISHLVENYTEEYNFLTSGIFSKEMFDNWNMSQIQIDCYFEKTGVNELINIRSKHQLGNFVFNYLKEEPIGTTEKGSPKFNDDFVEHISGKYKWASYLRIFNRLTKIKGAYFDRFLEENENGIWYPGFKQHGTTSGRYSSDAQQLPRPLDKDSTESDVVRKFSDVVRELIVPFEGYKFIDDDYESLEPRVFADDAGDEALIEIFTKDLDMYSVVAIMAEDIKDASADKKSPNFLKKKYPIRRQNAKSYALGIRYGMKDGKLAMTLNIEKPEAKKIIDNYFKAFPGLKKKMDEYIYEAKQNGTVTSKFGRVRHLPRLKEIYRVFGDNISDYFKWKDLSKRKRISIQDIKDISREYNNLINNALNFPIQSAATSIVNRAAIHMSKDFRKNNIDAWVSLQIHDQVVVMCKEEDVESCKKIVQNSMENTNKLAMPLIAKPEVASNLKEGH